MTRRHGTRPIGGPSLSGRRSPGARHSVYVARRGRRPLRVAAVATAVVVVLAAVFVVVQLVRPGPALAERVTLAPSSRVPSGGWKPPLVPQAETVVALSGMATIVAAGGQAETPIASVTKLMSVLVVLASHPLSPGEQGPLIPVTSADVASYERAKAALDSVVAVRAGEQLSELDALEAVLIPSADNVVRILARWDAGSTAAFVARMNAEARRLGLRHTHYAGPSGVDPGSVSTAVDQTKLAEIALRNPVVASIVSMPQVVLPVAGLQYNVDGDLGHDGIVGVKTGWVPQGGASFVFAAHHRVGGRRVTVIGSIVGVSNASPIPTALADAERIVRSVDGALVRRSVATRGEVVATLDPGYVSTVPLVAAHGADLVVWPGARLVETVRLRKDLAAPIRAGERVGALTVTLGSERTSVAVVAGRALAQASLGWRLTQL